MNLEKRVQRYARRGGRASLLTDGVIATVPTISRHAPADEVYPFPSLGAEEKVLEVMQPRKCLRFR